MNDDPTAPSMPCLICGSLCEYEIGCGPSDNPRHIPAINGLYVQASGNYGSTEFDPMGPQFLDAVICNPCTRLHANRFRYERMGSDENSWRYE